MIKIAAAPVVKTGSQTILSRELRLRAGDRKIVDDGSPRDAVTCNELTALADAFDYQEGKLDGYRAMCDFANQELAATQQREQNMRIAIRLMRFYALNSVILPDQDQVIAFLRSYIDDGRWLPMPWPTELPTCSKFLADAGYFDLNGYVAKVQPMNRPQGD